MKKLSKSFIITMLAITQVLQAGLIFHLQYRVDLMQDIIISHIEMDKRHDRIYDTNCSHHPGRANPMVVYPDSMDDYPEYAQGR